MTRTSQAVALQQPTRHFSQDPTSSSEEQWQVAELFSLLTLGIVPVSSPQGVPRNLPAAVTARLCYIACEQGQAVLLSKSQQSQGTGTPWRCSVCWAFLTRQSEWGTGTTQCVGQGSQQQRTAGCWSHWLAP